MQVKTFEGFTMTEAIQKVKMNFGNEAVILSTREKKLDNSNAKVIEVKAAVSEYSNKKVSSEHLNYEKNFEINTIEEKIQSLDNKLNSCLEKFSTKDQTNRIEAGLKELKILCLRTMRQLPNQLLNKIDTHVEHIYHQLQLMSVNESHLFNVLEHLKSVPDFNEAKLNEGDSSVEYYKSHAIRYMFQKIKIYSQFKPIKGHSQIHLFLGGSGVGKTCTIAKIASYFQIKEKAKVLLVSYDKYNIDASSLLKFYSKVLGVNHVTIDKPEELESTILKNRDCELVLVDTKGGLPKVKAELDHLNQLKEKPFPIDMHLVLSLTENSSQIDRTISSFSPLGIHSLIFSKLDESWTYGEMYNACCKWSIPLSFFSTGQKVPEDLEPASRERVIERIFGL